MQKMIFAAAMLAAALVGTSANAVPVTWTLQGVEFSDGTTVTGSFVYDADVDIFSGLSITTSGGTIAPSTSDWIFNTYFAVSSQNPNLKAGFVAVDAPGSALIGAHTIFLYAAGVLLTNAGGTLPLDFFRLATCYDANCSSLNASLPYATSGQGAFSSVSTSPAPEPLTLSLLGAGLAGLAATRRRRKA